MSILTISGSADPQGQNVKFLDAFANTFPAFSFTRFDVTSLPTFKIIEDHGATPLEVLEFRSQIINASAVIISTPEYLHNIPSTLKTALDWLASSGEFYHKKLLPISYTPNHPRGEKAMLSLLSSLKALDAQVIASLNLYSNDLSIGTDGKLVGNEQLEMLTAAIEMLNA